MSLIDTIAHSEAMLGYHDPTYEVGAIARVGADGAQGEAGADEGFFSTLLDVINPLQHIPFVSNLYREITGDEISPSAQILGGGLFGGPIGMASASANVLLEQASGEDLMGHALAMVSGEAEPGVAPRQAAAATLHEQADAGGHTDIVLAGPTALASFAPVTPPVTPPVALAPPVSLTPPAQQLAAAAPGPAKPVASDRLTQTPPAAAPETAALERAAPVTPASRAAAQALPANWVNEALRDTETMNQALQSGAAPDIGGTKPWVGNAILDALSKYEALTKARGATAQVGP